VEAPSVEVKAPDSESPTVVLGVCGGIAAYKVVDVCRQLVDAGVHVAPVLTAHANRFVGRTTFSALASEPAQTSLWDEDSPIPHTKLAQRAALVVVAPATADFLARYAAGMASDLLSATLLATRAPVLVCPAMHTEMWEHPSVQENLATLVHRGVHVVAPEAGRLAGGDMGTGRLADPATIVAAALELLAHAPSPPVQDMAGLRVVVSAGGTREPLDPVRFLTNRSSGKQGHAIALAAVRRGAEVTLVTAARDAVGSSWAARLKVVAVDTAAEMEGALRASAASADVLVMAAAVSDFRPKVGAGHKLSKEDGIPEIVLEPTPDILAGLVANRAAGQVIIGFAAETDDVIDRGRRKLARKGVDYLVVNDVLAPGAGFDHDTNEVTILDARGGLEEISMRSKHAVADALFDRVIGQLTTERHQ
jgi:phosphopantothenoylcysteine decarboxylase / phosphopantothenate---cysteine ligase